MKIPVNKLSYRLVLDGYGDYIPTPLGESSIVISCKLSNDDGPRYAYDFEAKGELTFSGADFNWIYERETEGYRCTEMLLEMKFGACGGADILPGTKIRLSDGHYDLDKCMVTFPVICPDPYECFNEKKVDKLNIFDAPGDAATVRLYDNTPTFEYNESQLTEPGGIGFGLSTQHYEWYPNRRVEYPLFGCEGEERDPFNPESGAVSLVLFNDVRLQKRKREPVTYEEILSTGSNPYHSDFPYFSGANDAAAVGWRLHSFFYETTSVENSSDPDHAMTYIGKWRWCREYILVPTGTTMPADWVYDSTIGSDDKFVRAPLMVPRKRKYNQFFTEGIAGSTNHFLNFIYSNYIVGEVDNIVDVNDETNSGNGWKNVYGLQELPNGKRLNDIIEDAVSHCCPGLTVKSEFLQINPDTVTSTNYVTGEDTYVNEIMVFQKSDVKRPWATEHATVGTYTPQELFYWLFVKFQLKFCIFGNVFRLEHISSPYFRLPVSIDLTTDPYNRMLAATRRYTYDISNLPAKEMFTFMEARQIVTFTPNDDFAGLPITYDGFCVNRKEGENVITRDLRRITNDIIFILINSGGAETRVTDNETANSYKVSSDVKKGVISDDGFSFVATRIDSGVRYGVVRPTILNTIDLFNNVMGFALLHDKFYRTDRNAASGTMNGVATTFDTTKFIKRQVRLPFELCCLSSFNPHEYMTTALSEEGVVKYAEWKPSDQTMRFDLIFRP